MISNKIPNVLTVAGSDSGGGAGIQADLKTFAETGSYGTSVITAVTAQNTLGVKSIQEIDLNIIEDQIDSVCTDIQPISVKTGMLFSNEIISLVAEKAKSYSWKFLVVDPVMVSSTGDKLLKDEAIDSYIRKLLPISYIATPNIPEAEYLTGIEINSSDSIILAAKKIFDFGVKNVLIKGGHQLKDNISEDILYDGNKFHKFSLERIKSSNTHGTGCSLSSALASYLAQKNSLISSIDLSKKYVWNGIKDSYPVGKGNGPINHFWEKE